MFIFNLFRRLPRPDDEVPIDEMPHTEGGIVKTIFEPSAQCFHKWQEIPQDEWKPRLYGKRISVIPENIPHTEHRRAYHCPKCGGEIVTATIK